MRLNHLLREMARKYDQYDDYMQQDAHELLRHLLDSMQMEEKDIIKRVQPPPTIDNGGKKKGKKANDGISPLPSPTPSTPTSPAKVKFSNNLAVDSEQSSKLDPGALDANPRQEVPEEERLVPFVDVLFGGLLASVVVCEHCRSVSP
jgi:ubiquitin carboxyl-terminal hydrolase 16/45